MTDSEALFFDSTNSPFCPATGKHTRLFKGGTPKPQPVAAARAAETANLVSQAEDDEEDQAQARTRRNEEVLASQKEETFGQKLKLGQ